MNECILDDPEDVNNWDNGSISDLPREEEQNKTGGFRREFSEGQWQPSEESNQDWPTGGRKTPAV